VARPLATFAGLLAVRRNKSSARRHASVTRRLHAPERVSTRAIAASVIEQAPVATDSNRYRLLHELGQGGMATVHLALLSGDAGFRKLVALKRAKPGLARDAEFLEMFMNEARLAARLNHPNVVQTYEVGRYDAEPYIAMEFLDGQPLHRLQRAVPTGIPLAIHLRIIAEALAGLHHAHELRDFSGAPLSVVHRDVSPQNVLVGYDGQAKVVDFGIAKAATQASYTELGLVKGKLSYMSPEQTLGESLDRRADLFAIGVMLWEAGAGRRLWAGEPARSRLRMLSLGEIPAFGPLALGAAGELERICRRALQYAAARRYQTAAELEADLDALRSQPGLHATRRDVAAFMATHFSAQRAEMQRLIEAELGHFSLSPVAPAEAEKEAVLGTRRVPAPVVSSFPPAPRDDTGTSLSPALASTDRKGGVPSASRRWFAVLLSGVVVVPAVALLWNARATGGQASSSTPIVDSSAVKVHALTSSEPSRVPATVSSAPRAPALLPVLSKKGGQARPASDTPASVGTGKAAPETPDSGMELIRERPRRKRSTRTLDTSDPWAH
jgi:serine/threonine protein kinase